MSISLRKAALPLFLVLAVIAVSVLASSPHLAAMVGSSLYYHC